MGFEKDKCFRPKYGNEPVEAIVDGQRIQFRSKLEYRWGQYLDFLKSVGEIKDWFFEFHKFEFHNREKPPYEYTPDFLVRRNDNTFEYYETKGLLLKYDLTKYKLLFDERPYVELTIVFWRRPKLSVQKVNKLNRYLQKRIIWNAQAIFENIPIDMS